MCWSQWFTNYKSNLTSHVLVTTDFTKENWFQMMTYSLAISKASIMCQVWAFNLSVWNKMMEKETHDRSFLSPNNVFTLIQCIPRRTSPMPSMMPSFLCLSNSHIQTITGVTSLPTIFHHVHIILHEIKKCKPYLCLCFSWKMPSYL
jgi:hypothetical protein